MTGFLYIAFIIAVYTLCRKYKRISIIVMPVLIPMIVASGFVLFIYPRPFKSTDLAYLLPENSKNIKADFKYAGLYYGCQMEGYSISKMEYEKDSAGSLVNSRRFSPWLRSIGSIVTYDLAYIYNPSFDECYDYFKDRYGMDLGKIMKDGGENFQIKAGDSGGYPIFLGDSNIMIFSMSMPGKDKLIFLKGDY